MNDILRACKNNLQAYLKNKQRAGIFTTKNLHGGFRFILTEDREYICEYTIDADIERFLLDLYPQIVCPQQHLNTTHMYVNRASSSWKSGRVDIDDSSGTIKIHTETSIVDCAVSIDVIEDLEKQAVMLSDSIEKRLEKLVNGLTFSEDDPDVLGSIETRLREIGKKIARHCADEEKEEDEDEEEPVDNICEDEANFDDLFPEEDAEEE